MRLTTLTLAMLLVTCLATGASGQDAASVVAAASKAMGADTLTSITYSGTARNGAFGQSKDIGEPMGPVNVTKITQYTRPSASTGRRAECAGVPRDRSDAAADRAGRAAAGAGRVQPEHHRHAGRQQLDAGAQHLDDAVGLPEGGGRATAPRCGSRAASRSSRSRRRTSSRRPGRPTPSPVTSTARIS